MFGNEGTVVMVGKVLVLEKRFEKRLNCCGGGGGLGVRERRNSFGDGGGEVLVSENKLTFWC